VTHPFAALLVPDDCLERVTAVRFRPAHVAHTPDLILDAAASCNVFALDVGQHWLHNSVRLEVFPRAIGHVLIVQPVDECLVRSCLKRIHDPAAHLC